MSAKRSLVFLLLAAGLAAGCSNDGEGPEPTYADVTGTWDAVVTVTGGTAAAPGTEIGGAFTLLQTGDIVAGTYVLENGKGGQLSGVVSGRTLVFGMAPSAPCTGSFVGTASVEIGSYEFTGAYSGYDCDGTLEASLVADKR